MEYAGLLVGLGNPGERYAGTRHNCGFMFVDAAIKLASKQGSVEELNGKRFNALLWRVKMYPESGIWLVAKPLTFMNDSGRAVQPIMAWHKLKPAQLVVVHDELDIPAGELRFKFGGGLAGHKGLASIAEFLGSKDFYRLRIGIGKPVHKSAMLDWVLSRPSACDKEKLASALAFAIESFLAFIRNGLEDAMRIARQSGKDGAQC